MKIYFTFNRSLLAALLAASILIILVVGQFSGLALTDENAKTNGSRIDFIKNLGYTPQEEVSEVKTFIVPYEFSDVYENYNKLQSQAGYDLKPYCGLSVTRYTYLLSEKTGEEPLRANLLVYKNKIIGGDIASVEIDGEMLPLKKIR